MKTVTIEKIKACIKLHEKMQGSYFWKPISGASARRSYEKDNSLITKFTHNKQKIEIIQETECSCKNIYYNMGISIDGEVVKKDIRFLKKLIKIS